MGQNIDHESVALIYTPSINIGQMLDLQFLAYRLPALMPLKAQRRFSSPIALTLSRIVARKPVTQRPLRVAVAVIRTFRLERWLWPNYCRLNQ